MNTITEQMLVDLYFAYCYGPKKDQPGYCTLAELCDEYLDKSGALLGRVREKALSRYEVEKKKGVELDS